MSQPSGTTGDSTSEVSSLNGRGHRRTMSDNVKDPRESGLAAPPGYPSRGLTQPLPHSGSFRNKGNHSADGEGPGRVHRRTYSDSYGGNENGVDPASYSQRGYPYPPQMPSARGGQFMSAGERPINNRHRRSMSDAGEPLPIGGMPPRQDFNYRGWSGPGQGPPPPYQYYQQDPSQAPGGHHFLTQSERAMSADLDRSNLPLGPAQSRRKRKERGPHRRTLSTSAVPSGNGAYNAFFNNSDLPPPSPSPRQPRDAEFNPHAEFLSLTGSFPFSSGKGGTPLTGNTPVASRKAPMSPQYPGQSPYMHGGGQNDMQMPWTPNRQHQHQSYGATSPSTVASADSGLVLGPHGPPLPGTYHGAGISGGSSVGSGGGEAVFMAREIGKHHKRVESTRVRHMRQQSAQIFMEEFKGTEQPPACRDVLFLLLFLFHLVGMIYLGTTYGQDAFDQRFGRNPHESIEDGVELYYENLMFVACVSGAFAVVLSTIAFALVTILARRFVQVALILAITTSFAWGTIGIGLSPKNLVPISGFLAFAFSVGYTFIVWDRIPFTASNLITALSGIKANLRTLLVAFFFQILALIWSLYFAVVVVGVYDAFKIGKLELQPNLHIFIYVMLGISFYWTTHVLLNLVQVTVAGIVSRWWYLPCGKDDPSAVHQSFFRSVFYGLGSICFGSLLVGPVRLIRQLSALVRPASSEEGPALLCLHQCVHCIQTCIANCVDGLADHCNPWAFTYIGLYGYSFLDAGQHATDLFQKRGWSMIVTDDLVPNILLMTSLVIGGATGVCAHLIDELGSKNLSSSDSPGLVSFCVGVVIGLVVTSVLFSVISSSVNTVIVCFAASPVDFEQNHPKLSHEMRTAWREVWPGCMDLVDLRLSIASMHASNNMQPMIPNAPNYNDPYNHYDGLDDDSSRDSRHEHHPLLA